jgi:outer membrane receptor for ferrienterochelin and colicins
VRGDVDSWFGGAVAPSLGTRLDPVEALTVRGSVGVGWRAPSFRELLLRFDNAGVGYQVTGNPDLVPEQSLSTSLGLEIAPTEALSFSVEGHRDQLRNLIQLTTLDDDPANTVFGYANIARARTQGIEAGFGWDPSLLFGLDLSGTLLDAVDLDTGNTLEGRANLRGTAAVRLKPIRGGPGLTTRAMIVGPRPFYVDEAFGLGGPSGGGGDRVDAPPYALMDARLEQPLANELRLFAGVENLLDAGDPRYLPTPPRLIYAGLDARVASKGNKP